MSTITNTKMLAAATAVAISSAGLLIYLPPAQAQPCKQWGFDGAVEIIEHGTGWEVGFTSIGTVASGRAYAINNKTGETQRIGTITGGFTSPTELSLTIQYPEGTQIYRGAVDSFSRARGVTAQPPFDGIGWDTTTRLSCVDPPTRAAPPPEQKAPPPPPEKAPPPAQAPTNAISVNISDVAGGLKVNVNNSSSVAGNCTYDATAPNSLIPPFLSRPSEDCEGCPALAGVRNLGLDDPSPDRPVSHCNFGGVGPSAAKSFRNSRSVVRGDA